MSQNIPILLYNSVNDQPPADFKPWAVGRGMFEAHLNKLVELGCVGLTVGSTHRADPGRSPRAGTGRGGDLRQRIRRLCLERMAAVEGQGFSGELYVTAGLVGGSSESPRPKGAGRLPILGAVDIGDLSDTGVEIGAHGMSHSQLDAVGRERAWREILDSKNALEAIVRGPVETFAYPHGYHDRATKKMVADAGYTSAAAWAMR